ncbi:phage integrase SAM-like domain-containing protein [Antarcticirhabdus aurantiaca]|uniref:Phage integrase SAM-like domain-containing protein n=1 Tax=Antarcticirhabdus aurantiaca TaxID=2606717 RepID=A0ACD4NIN5_9HYPH|nr:phage integrase SAM-like domain-containing protein [Antarcticirhabdus aurantiaca]WAJ26670.1 phage integrase SAM-like domain-containing protein [Jeongeuplla avenae]
MSLSLVMPFDGDPTVKPIKAPQRWLQSQQLAVPFAEAVYIAMSKNGSETFRRGFTNVLKFFDFLHKEGSSQIDLCDISTEMLNGYALYLAEVFDSPNTRRQYFGALRSVINTLRKTPAYAGMLSPQLRVPKNPWKGSDKAGKSRPGVPIAELVKIERACLKEIGEALAKFETGRRLVREHRQATSSMPEASMTLAATLSTVVVQMHGYLPDMQSADDLSAEFGQGVREAGGVEAVWSYLHLTARSLIPFIVLFCIRTAFNAMSCVGASKDCVRESPILIGDLDVSGSDRRHRVRVKKNRARFLQNRTYPASDRSIDNPVVLVRLVRKHTKSIRRFVVPHHVDRLFIYPSTLSHAVQGYNLRGGSNFQNNLGYFIAENNLVKFSLANIRPTIDEIVDILTDGDLLAKQAVLNHQHHSTTDAHYTSDASRERRRERLGEYQNQRQRWVATGGKSDPRRSEMGGTRRAATGGWECGDPYDSPIIGELPGRLCQAWGCCPTCWMAGVNPNDSYGLARIIQLEASIELAKPSISSARWLGHWLPVLTAIRTIWLPLFVDEAVWREAQTIRLQPLDIVE